MGYNGKSITIPVGLEMSKYEHKGGVSKKSFCFIGSLDWMPNLQGLEWFLQNVWPDVNAANPQYEFHIAGKNAPMDFTFEKNQNIT